MPKPLTAAVFWDDDNGKKAKPRVHPGRLVIDSRDGPTSVEFHSFVDQDVELHLPSPAFDPEPKVLRAGGRVNVPIQDPHARGCFPYKAHLVRDNKDAQGGSMPRMIILG
jgi:hypothetical protein